MNGKTETNHLNYTKNIDFLKAKDEFIMSL